MRDRGCRSASALCVPVIVLLLALSSCLPAEAGRLTLTWTVTSTNEDGFEIERREQSAASFARIATVGRAQSSYADDSATDGVTYCYRVRSFNAAGYSAYSNEACAATAQAFSLTVVKLGTGSGTVSSTPAGIACGSDCSEPYVGGTSVTLAATPATGSTFAGWSGDGDCADGAVTMTATKTCMATFNAATAALTVTRTGSGSGTVLSAPAGINCGSDCSEAFTVGTSVTLTATPATGSTFAGWSGNSDCTDGIVTMSAAKSCTATFNLTTATLTVSRAGAGSGTVLSTPAGINCGSDCTEAFTVGASVTLTAAPAAGSTFAGWSGDSDCADGVLTMSAARACTATFNVTTATLTVSRAGTGSGSVASTPPGIACGSDCTEAYPSGTSVTLTAAPAAGSTFAGWSGDSDCADGVLTMSAARACTATFNAAPVFLTVSKTGSGSGTISSTPAGIVCGSDCSEAYPSGTSVTLTATPAAGSTFAGWSGDSDCADGVLTMSAARACSATFSAVTGTPAPAYTLTVSTDGNGDGTVSSQPAGISCGNDCSESYPAGTQVTLSATPAPGSRFFGWRGDRDCRDGIVTLNAAKTCSAVFRRGGRR